jgi:ankyrin repeat protein
MDQTRDVDASYSHDEQAKAFSSVRRLSMRRSLPLLLLLLLASGSVLAQDLNEQLLAAARKGDPALARTLIEKGADVNAKTRYGATPLSYACDRGNVELVRLLIEKGANVDVKDTFYGATPIIWAAQKGHADVVKLLLEKGAKGRDEAMSIAISEGSLPLARAVLESGTAPQQSLDNWLTTATRNKQPEIAELIQKAGGKPIVLTEFKISPEAMQSYVGTYKDETREYSFLVREGKLVLKSGQREFISVSTAMHTFEFPDIPGLKIVFNTDGDRIVSATFKQPGSSDLTLKKAEAK